MEELSQEFEFNNKLFRESEAETQLFLKYLKWSLMITNYRVAILSLYLRQVL